ncbi:WD40 repeat-like protein [Neoconidiobolus thromboides FSU 785]|nr:WD40 repeat-like protein [Neoconidiobolus thromboides FSU 785]
MLKPYFVYRGQPHTITALRIVHFLCRNQTQLPFLLVGNSTGDISFYSLKTHHLCFTISLPYKDEKMVELNSIIEIIDIKGGYFCVYNRAIGITFWKWEVQFEQLLKKNFEKPTFLKSLATTSYNFCKVYLLDNTNLNNENTYFSCPTQNAETQIVSVNLKQMSSFEMVKTLKSGRKEDVVHSLWYNYDNNTYFILAYSDGAITFNCLTNTLDSKEIWKLTPFERDNTISCIVIDNDYTSLYCSSYEGGLLRVILKYSENKEDNLRINIEDISLKKIKTKDKLQAICISNQYYLFSAHSDGEVLLYSKKSLRLIKALNYHQGTITSLLCTTLEDKEALFVASNDRKISLWEV